MTEETETEEQPKMQMGVKHPWFIENYRMVTAYTGGLAACRRCGTFVHDLYAHAAAHGDNPKTFPKETP